MNVGCMSCSDWSWEAGSPYRKQANVLIETVLGIDTG
jgi:hypothetical protein